MEGSAPGALEPQTTTCPSIVLGKELAPLSPVLLTVQDLIDFIAKEPGLEKQQRRNERCALGKLAQATKLPLAAIRLDPDYLNNEVFTIPHSHVGVSEGRWRSICSTCRGALKRAGIYTAG